MAILEDDDSAMRREFVAGIKACTFEGPIAKASPEWLEAFVQKLQDQGQVTLRRHDGRVILSWERWRHI